MSLPIDQYKMIRTIDAKLAEITDPRRRQILECFRQHAFCEVTANLEDLMATTSSKAHYHSYIDNVCYETVGYDEVRAYYAGLFATATNILEYDIEKLVVGKDIIASEGIIRQIYPGTAMISFGFDPDEDLNDPDIANSFYMLTTRLTMFYPFNEEGQMMAEDSYVDGPMTLEKFRKLTPEEVSPEFLALVEQYSEAYSHIE